MDRRNIATLLLPLLFLFVWMQIAPQLFPQFFPKPGPKKPVVENPAGENAGVENQPAAAVAEANESGSERKELERFREQAIVLDGGGFANGSLLRAEFTTRGAAINWLELTDPRYTTDDGKAQLKVVGNDIADRKIDPRTFEMLAPAFDAQLNPYNESLTTVHWEVAAQDDRSIEFRYPSPDGKLELRKRYTLPIADVALRDAAPDGYLLQLEFEIRNVSTEPQTFAYSMYGPVGVPLENAENTRLYREAKIGLLTNGRNPQSVSSINLTAAALVKQTDKALANKGKIDDWREPIRFAGVDQQFFAALVLPHEQLTDLDGDGAADPYFALVRPELLSKDVKHPERSDLTIVLESRELTLPPQSTTEQKFEAFFGPKRPELLAPLQAESVIQLGWFAIVAKSMLWILGFFHSLGLPYAAAIIALTMVVRTAMFPISRKQAIEGEKMKVLAPKLKEIQEKHKNQPEEFARAYREFQKKHNYHPMVGCLPALLQLPIFIGLYNALFHAVDLRMARFLWIENLAAPDALFSFGTTLPLLGWSEFNLLPMITVGLFVLQTKMFTPPPTSDEQAMQQKMMSVMMIVIGFMFYRVPAGLCLYFISSSLFGIAERLFLKKKLAQHAEALTAAGAEGAGNVIVIDRPTSGSETSARVKTPSWWDKIVEAADQAKNTTEGQRPPKKFSKDKKSRPRR